MIKKIFVLKAKTKNIVRDNRIFITAQLLLSNILKVIFFLEKNIKKNKNGINSKFSQNKS